MIIKLYININDALVHTFENFVIDDNFKEAINPNTDVNDFYRYTDGKNDNLANVNGINITIKRGWKLKNLGHLKLAFDDEKHFYDVNDFDDTQVNVHVHCEINDKNKSIFIKNIEKFINIEENKLRYREITFEKYKEEKPKENEEEKPKEKPKYFLFRYKEGKITNMYIVIPFLEFIKFYNPVENKTLIDIATDREIKTILATEYIKSHNIKLDAVCEKYKTEFEETQGELKTKETELNEATTELSRITGELKTKETELEEATTELENIKKELETAKDQLIKESELIELMKQNGIAKDKYIEKRNQLLCDIYILKIKCYLKKINKIVKKITKILL